MDLLEAGIRADHTYSFHAVETSQLPLKCCEIHCGGGYTPDFCSLSLNVASQTTDEPVEQKGPYGYILSAATEASPFCRTVARPYYEVSSGRVRG